MRHQPPRRTRSHLDRVLDGRPTTRDPLDALVAGLQAPGSARESAGLDAALAAFAVQPEGAAGRKPSMLKSLAGKVLATKLMAAAASALAVGGVAYAATTGHLSDPKPHTGHVAPAATSHMPTTRPATSAPGTAGLHSRVADPTHHTTSATTTHPAAKPSPSLVGLCRAWLARPSHAGKADQSPAAAALIAAAGGRDSVTRYCTALLVTTRAHHPTNKPSHTPKHHSPPGHQHTGPPTHPPHPTGKPTAPGHHNAGH